MRRTTLMLTTMLSALGPRVAAGADPAPLERGHEFVRGVLLQAVLDRGLARHQDQRDYANPSHAAHLNTPAVKPGC